MEYYNEDYLAHHGVKGQKWGVRRYQNKDGSLTNAGKKRRYLDDDGALTRAGKKQMKKLNRMDEGDNIDRYYRKLAQRNVDKFSSKKDPVSKVLTKLNKKHVSNYDKVIARNKEAIGKVINDMKDQKVDVVIRYDPDANKMYYKQSDAQSTRAKDSKLYRNEGISISRDEEGRIASVKVKDANEKSIKKANKIARNGYY